MSCSQRSLPTDRENDQAIAILKKGAYLLKYGRRGKPKFYPFRLSSDEIFLLWYCGKTEKRLKLSSVTRIIPGQRTSVFRRYPQPTKEYQSFSLIYGDRSLDLVCKDKDEAEFWITTLRALLSRNSSSPLVLHSRSRSFVPDYGGEQSSSSNNNSISNIRSVSSDTSCEEHAKKASGSSHINTPQRLGKVFSEVLSQTAVLRALSLDELVHKPHNASPETALENRPTTNNHSPAVDTSKCPVVSSAVSTSSQGSTFEDLKSLCDVFVWGESIGDGLLGCGGGVGGGGAMHKSESSSSLTAETFLPKVLKSHVALDAQSISCGTNYAVLVTKQGQVYSWGEESGGRLGHGVCSSYVPQPKLIDEFDGSSVELADCGEFHACAVTSSGDLYTWGDGAHNAGLLGLGSEASHWKPVRILGQMEGVNVKTISCGPWHTAFVTSEGKLFTYGDGTFGALGHGDRVSTSAPREAEALSGCRTIKIACGVWHSAAVVSVFGDEAAASGKLFTWGDGEDGKLGHGDKESRLIPSCVTELDATSFQQVACGQSVTVALSTSGQVYAMGVVDPGHENVVRPPSCVEGGGLGKSCCSVQEVACGFHHIAVLTSKAEVYTWGRGSNGQLGHGDTEYKRLPTLVRALKGKQVRKVVCGSNYTATICLHKPITGTDSSRCSGCRHPFNYMRKLHNCYNCGSVFCNACTSKKSLAAAMAPKTNRPYRVCDDCYVKLEGVREYLGTPANNSSSARFSNASLQSSVNETEDFGATPQRQLLRVDSFDFFRQSKIPDLKTIGETSGASSFSSSFNLKGIRQLSRLASFDSVNQEGKQRTKHCASKSDTSSLVRHSVTCGLPFSRRGSVELFPLSIKSSPVESVGNTSDFATDITDTELMQEGTKKSNQCLNQEISVLKAQVEELTRKTKQLEGELGTTSKKLEVAVLMQRDDAEKIKTSEEMVRSLTLQLMDATKKGVDKTRRRRSSF